MHLPRASAFYACLLFGGVACAQPNSDPVLQALLTEVRQLRLALERSAVVGPKIQVTLQRIQLQQEFVSRLSRQMEDVRDRMAQAAADESRRAAQIKQFETALGQEQDPLRRKAMEEEIKAIRIRSELEREQQSIQQGDQRARESELAARLRAEQGKLDELNERLNVLERLLEPPKQP